jgi:hypothetical protein
VPLATYSDLQAEVGAWLRRSDLAGEIPTCIALAEAVMNRELRTCLQLVTQTYEINGAFVDKPVGFRMMRSLRLTSGAGRVLEEITPEQMAACKAGQGSLTAAPRFYTAVGPQLEFWPVPNETYAAIMQFQAGFTPLSDAAPSNWILADHPDAYLFGALANASGYVKNDERAQAFDQVFRRALDEIQEALRTTYDRTLGADPMLIRRGRLGGTFNFITGDV